MTHYDLKLGADEADLLTVAVLKDTLGVLVDMIEDGTADPESKEDVEAFVRVINYLSTPDQHI